jgi:hypothetical protein
MYDCTINASDECTCIGIGQITGAAHALISTISVVRPEFAVNITGNFTVVGVGAVTHAGLFRGIERGTSTAINNILLDGVSGFLDAEDGAAIGAGSAVHVEPDPGGTAPNTAIVSITINNSRALTIVSKRGSNGGGLGMTSIFTSGNITIVNSSIKVSSVEGAAIGPSAQDSLRPNTRDIRSITIANSSGTFTSGSADVIGSMDMVDRVVIENAGLSVTGKVGRATSSHPNSTGVSFIAWLISRPVRKPQQRDHPWHCPGFRDR